MKFDKLKVGEVYFTITRHKMGNTTIQTISVHPVRVKEIEPERRSVIASWNGNAPQRFYESSYSKWRAEKPLLIRGGIGSHRLATREEIKAHKASHSGATAQQGEKE